MFDPEYAATMREARKPRECIDADKCWVMHGGLETLIHTRNSSSPRCVACRGLVRMIGEDLRRRGLRTNGALRNA